jgi:hypothetical protein
VDQNFSKFKMSRPVVSVFDPEVAESVIATVSLPAVFTAPIRSDIVHYVHTLMSKNARQAYAVSLKAGHQVCKLCCLDLSLFNLIEISFTTIRLLLNLGVLVELFLVFLVYQVVELLVQAKVHSVICAEVVECLDQQKFGEDGTEKSVSTKEDLQ